MSGAICNQCGAVEGSETLGTHVWTEGCCILPEHDYRRAHPPRATVGHVCRGCVERLRDWLSEITDLYATLPDVIELGSVPDDTAQHRHTKRPASPAPMRLEAWAMLHDRDRLALRYDPDTKESADRYMPGDIADVLAELIGWANSVEIDLDGNPAAQPKATLSEACSVLTIRMERIAGWARIDEFDADLKFFRRQLRQAHGNPKPIGKCISIIDGRECRGQVWPSKRQHDPRPECSRCHRRYDNRDTARLTFTEAREASRDGVSGIDPSGRRPRLRHAADGSGRA